MWAVISNSTRRVLRLRADGRSSLNTPPQWLASATRISLELNAPLRAEGSSNGSTRLVTQAPILSRAAPNAFDQLNFWGEAVTPQDTAISLLEDAIRDAVNGKKQSDLIDRAVLGSFAKFSEVLDLGFDAISLNGGDAPPVTIDRAALEQVEQMEMTAPRPRKVIVSGTVDMLRNSKRTFVLELKGGRKIRGFYSPSQAASIASFFTREVVIDGEAHFRASGEIASIVASNIQLAGPGDEIWSTVPQAAPRDLDDIKPKNLAMTGRNPFSRLFGAWPGDESDEQVKAMLEKLS